MSFSTIKSFNEGNFDRVFSDIKSKLELINSTTRKLLIPNIDKALDYMLDFNGNGSKDCINIQYNLDENYTLKDIKVCVEYTVKDFNVPLAPKDAVEQDSNSIKEYLENAGLIIESVTIDSDSGKLTVVMDINSQEESSK